MDNIKVIQGTHGHLGLNKRQGRRGKLPGRKSPKSTKKNDKKDEEIQDNNPAVDFADIGEEEVTKQSLCVEILSRGFVQSYVDFFYLTHRPDPNATLMDGEVSEIDMSVQDMTFVKDTLINAEASRRRAGEIDSVYKSYNELAKHFQDNNDNKTGIYFYEKCLEIARMTVDTAGEMKANHNLGVAAEAAKEYPQAIQFHERHLEMAEIANIHKEMRLANNQLVNVYAGYAESMENDGDYEEAVTFHQRCLDAAIKTENKKAEGLASFRLGRAKVMLGRSEEGMGHLEEYLGICQELNDLEGQGQAHSALAAAHQAVESPDDAVSSLQQYLKISEQMDNLSSQAEACCNLGVLFNQKKLFDRAVKYFQRNFDITRTLASRGECNIDLVDKSRVNLGMSKGNQALGSYMYAINYDTASLLKWKNSRVEIMSSG